MGAKGGDNSSTKSAPKADATKVVYVRVPIQLFNRSKALALLRGLTWQEYITAILQDAYEKSECELISDHETTNPNQPCSTPVEVSS